MSLSDKSKTVSHCGVVTALSAIASSATCGVFTLGMMCWWVGPRGAFAGATAGALVAGAVSLGTQAAAASGLQVPALNYTMQCVVNASIVDTNDDFDPETIFPLFRISYHWIAPLGLLATLTVGSIVGWFFDRHQDIKIDAELFTPLVWGCLLERAHEYAGSTRRAQACQDSVPPHAASLISVTVDKIEMNDESSR